VEIQTACSRALVLAVSLVEGYRCESDGGAEESVVQHCEVDDEFALLGFGDAGRVLDFVVWHYEGLFVVVVVVVRIL